MSENANISYWWNFCKNLRMLLWLWSDINKIQGLKSSFIWNKRCCLTFDTSNFRVSSVPFRTETNWFVVCDITLSIGATVAWVHTVSVETCLYLRTVIIGCTSNNHNSWNEIVLIPNIFMDSLLNRIIITKKFF